MMTSKKEQTRAALLQAALELFAERGLDNAPTALIAKRAGVASGTLFFHFRNKEELIHALFREIRLKMEKRVMQDVSELMPIGERFVRSFSELLRYCLKNPKEFKFVEQYHFSPLSNREYDSSGERESLRDLLLEARDRHYIRDLPLLLLEALAFGPIASLAKEHANCGTLVDEKIVALTIESIWNGLQN